MKTNNNIKAVMFDFDGTLVQIKIDFTLIRREMDDLFASHDVPMAQLKGLYLLEMINRAKVMLDRDGSGRGSDLYHEAHELLINHELDAAKKGDMIPGVIEMLEQLRRNQIKIAIITRNCERAVNISFPQILEYCDVFLPRDYVAHVKPHPGHLDLACKKIGIDKSQSMMMVGDHPLDIYSGKNAGMETAGVLTGNSGREDFINAGADYILNDATEVLELCVQERRNE